MPFCPITRQPITEGETFSEAGFRSRTSPSSPEQAARRSMTAR